MNKFFITLAKLLITTSAFSKNKKDTLEEMKNWRCVLLRLFDDEGERKEFRIAIWNLLRGHNIIQRKTFLNFFDDSNKKIFDKNVN